MRAGWLVVTVFLFTLPGCGPKQPANPIELHLKLGKNKLQSGEYLWYLLEIKNVGRKPIPLWDYFFFVQAVLDRDSQFIRALLGGVSKIHLEIVGPDGERVGPRNAPYGLHAEHKFWTNDCGGGKNCEKLYTSPKNPEAARMFQYPEKILAGGETWSVTPSMVAPVKPRNRDKMADMGDMRALPPFEEERLAKDPKKLEEARRQWKRQMESIGYLHGDVGFKPDDKKPAVERFRGYRILDTYDFDDPGPYRMRFVFTPHPTYTLEGMEHYLRREPSEYPTIDKIERWINRLFGGRDYALHDYLRGCGWPEETRGFRYISNWAEFEVVSAPFPDHLLKPRPGETAKERAQRDWLRSQLRESSLWADDTPEERERKLRKMREANEKHKRRMETVIKAVEEIRQEKRQGKKGDKP